jgi:hypothetical protein
MFKLTLSGSLLSQTSITLTFTANAGSLHQPLDSVLVENITLGVDTVLYHPDTVLVLGSRHSRGRSKYICAKWFHPFPYVSESHHRAYDNPVLSAGERTSDDTCF